MTDNKDSKPRQVPTLPANGPSGGSIRPEVIRAMERQHKAAQGVLDELQALGEDVRRALRFGMIRLRH